MKKKENIKDVTLKVLISIRDEISGLREDTNARFRELEQDMSEMKQDMSAMKQDMASVKQDIKAIAAHFDRDYLLLANDVGNLKGRVTVCEKALNIAS